MTRELQKHFADFFASYKKGIVGNTDKMGVWISGFFGSGKSHFLKILSYLVENRVVDGKAALDYFTQDNKIKDEMVLADMKLAANTSADVILFNIDSKSGMADTQNNKEAILSVFLKVFNQQLGFYGANPHLADLERNLAEEGKYEDFKNAFAELRGKEWVDSRHQFRFIQDYVCKALVKIDYMSMDAAKNACESFTQPYNIDISTFAKMVNSHIKKQGNNHHVVFLVDEIGQYIGDKIDLMLNLQTVTEDLGSECGGKAWVIVTSQQDIDSITKTKGNDFSKIQGRFDSRQQMIPYFIEQLRKTYQEQPTDKLDIEQVQSRIEELKASTMALIQDSVLSNTVGENERRLKTMSDEIKALSDMITDYKNSQNNINIESTINDLEEILYSEPDQNDEYDDDLVRQLIDTIKVVGDDKLIFTFKCGLVYEQPIQLQVRRLKKSA